MRAAAQRSIHLEAYIYYPGSIADALLAALCERARCGVRVRVVIDAIGSLRTGPSYFKPLIAAGGQVSRYHPLHLRMLRRWNSRTHRNLLVVDGEVGFIGGAGIADHWCRSVPLPWRDCALRVTGPIVAGLQAVFALCATLAEIQWKSSITAEKPYFTICGTAAKLVHTG